MNVWKKALATLALALGGFAMAAAPALASVSVTGPATANVSSDSATGTSVALPPLTLLESAAGDISAGTQTWALPSGFVFDTTSLANVIYGGTGLAGSAAVSFPDSAHVSLTISATSTTAGSLTIGSVTPLKVKASNGTPIAAAGNILLSSGTMTGVASTTSFGLLTQVAGAASKLAFTVQPPATASTTAAFSAAVSVEDQFGNVLSNDSSHTVTLSALLASTTLGTLSGTLNKSDASGVSSFNDLSFNAPNQIQLAATSGSLASSTSSVINIVAATTATTTPTPTSTPPSDVCASLGFRNGMLVKVQGSPTVYLVVNCTLRPFNSAAIFHARGKKFEDIREFSQGLLGLLKIGKNVGDSDDDNIPTPPTSTSTPPSLATTTPPTISGLPDGSIVKLPGNPTVYMVSGGQLQPFTSILVFNLRGKHFKDVQTITQAQFSSLTVGAPVTLPDGTLIKGHGKTVFMIMNGQAMGVTSASVLTKHGKSFKDVINVNDGDLNGIPHGGNQDN